MESFSKRDEPLPSPPPYFITDEKGDDVRFYHVNLPLSPPPPTPPQFSPDEGLTNKGQLPFPATHTVSAHPPAPPLSRFTSYEEDLRRSPGLTTCPSCQVQVTTDVTYRPETYAWLMCLVFVVCGMVLGCCLIPFFVRYFKSVYHTCPVCRRVLHVHRKTCCGR